MLFKNEKLWYFITISATALRVYGYLENNKADNIVQQVRWKVALMFIDDNDINDVNAGKS